jgi:cullin 1
VSLLSYSALLNHTNRNEADADKADLDPKAYVDALLAVHEKNAATVARSFKAEAGFAAALDKACREFVNRNAATGRWLSFID